MALALVTAVVFAQSPPPSDGPPASVLLHGRVVVDDRDATPVFRARIAVQATDDPLRDVFTDRDGAFALRVAADRRYHLTVSKPGFPTHELERTATADPLLIRLPRGAVVTGRLVDAFGGPAAVPVVLRGEITNGGPLQRLAFSDDRGEFRFGSLPAGRYEVFFALSTFTGATTSAPTLPVTMAGFDPSADADPAAVVTVAAGEAAELVLPYTPPENVFSLTVRAGRIAPVGPVAPRDGPGTGAIAGRVSDAAGRPIGGASVVLEPVGGGTTVAAATDGSGRYALTGVPAGTFRVAAVRSGFMTAEYGWTVAPHQGQTLTLRDNSRRDDVDIVMPPTPAISGRIVDEHGEPLQDIAVHPWTVTFDDGGAVLAAVTTAAPAVSDDRGHYRIHGLLPGTYYVSAFEPPSPTPTGRLLTGEVVFRRVYYPGRLSPFDAAAVHIDPGGEATGIDLVHDAGLLQTMSRVSGRMIDATGAPLTGTVILMGRRRVGGVAAPPMVYRTHPDGAFEFSYVPPGDYVLHGLQQGLGAFPRAFGRQFVTVTPEGAPPIVLRLVMGATITGHIVLEGNDAGTPRSAFRLGVIPADPDFVPPQLAQWPWGLISRDGIDVEIGGLTGPVRIVADRVPEGWWLKSVAIDGIEATVEPVVFDPGDRPRSGFRAVFSDGAPELTGQVLDERRVPTSAYSVVVFATDRRRWFHRSPFLRIARAEEEGRFRVTSLPPGEYWVIAVDAIDGDAGGGAWQRPEMLEHLIAGARRIRLDERQRADIDLPLVRLPR